MDTLGEHLPRSDDDPPLTALEDLIAGGIAGSMSVVVGHPFDTYKVRLQTSSSKPFIGSYGGISSLYRGITAPLSTAVIVNAIIFASYAESVRVWDAFLSPSSTSKNIVASDSFDVVDKYRYLPWFKALVCGGIVGSVQALVTCPMEHIKCRLQIQHGRGSTDHIYRGSFDATQKIVQSHGIRGLYRGLPCTILREIPAFGSYFATYDIVKDYTSRKFCDLSQRQSASTLKSYDGKYYRSIDLFASALAGGFSGAISWIVVYPLDVIKTKIQTAPFDTPPNNLRIDVVARQIVSKHGWKHLFRGLGVSIVRAFPVNGTIFPVYEFTLSHLRNNGVT